MKAKRIVAAVSLLVILVLGIYAVVFATGFERTYDGNIDAAKLFVDHEAGADPDMSDANSVADIMVKQNLSRKEGVGTMAQNNVAAIVFDYRGYDTLGESFILLTAIAGSFVILSRVKKKKEDEE